MTEHDHTGQTATDQVPEEPGPGAGLSPDGEQPVLPSPYLGPGETVPHAYLAPPQPNQPGYGSPSPAGQRSLGPGRQVTGTPGTGRSGTGRSPRSARASFGSAAGRDPVLAAPGERLAACLLDWIIIFVASVLAFLSPLLHVWHQFQAVAARYPNLNGPSAQAAVDAIARNPANQQALLFWFLGMFGIALAYYWVQHAFWGATVGKRVLSIKVVTAADLSAIGVRAAGLRAIAFLAGPAVFLLLPSPVNVIGGLLWLADVMTPLVDRRAQCLHDKLAGTVVVSQRRLRSRAGSSPSSW